MGLLRKCRVNAALTIQLFSQLFHFVNMWTFNLVVSGQTKVGYFLEYSTDATRFEHYDNKSIKDHKREDKK